MSHLDALDYAGLVDEIRDLADAARDVLAARPQDPLAGASEGFFGIGLPEAEGGAGGSLAELAPIVEAAGALGAATAVPWTSGVAGRALIGAGGDGIARISHGLPVAIPAEAAATVAARLRVSGGTVSGGFLALGAPGDPLMVPVHQGDECSFVLIEGDYGGVRRAVTGFDRTRSWTSVTLDEVPIAGRPTVSGTLLFDTWQQNMAAVFALDAAGAARAALTQTIVFSEAREQFGRAVGSFQAYKHRLANAFIELKLTQALAYRTAASESAAEFPTLAYSAALDSTTSATRICGEAIQLHGGIGFTWEAGLHLLLRRARADEILAKAGSTARNGILKAA